MATKPQQQVQAPGVYDINATVQKSVVDYAIAVLRRQNHLFELRDRLEYADRMYLREMDMTEEQIKARIAARKKDPTKVQNIQVPQVLEVVENHVSFLMGVFGSEFPMFQFAAGRKYSKAALMINTLVQEDQTHFGWLLEFNKAFRDGGKYNLAAIEQEWKTINRYSAQVGPGGTVVAKEEKYSGVKFSRKDLYNCLFDPTVPLAEQHKRGECAGYMERINRIELKQYLQDLGTNRLKNDAAAINSDPAIMSSHYYVPSVNPNVIAKYLGAMGYADETDWDGWMNGTERERLRYKQVYWRTTLYVRLIPKEFHIRKAQDQTPDIWKFVLINDVPVWVAPVNELHEFFPLTFTQPIDDGLDVQTKSLGENQYDFQHIASGLWNAKMQSARRRLTDRVIYNPLLIDPDVMNSPNPSAKIPVKQTAFGRPLNEAVYQFPFTDDNSQYYIQEANAITQMGMRAAGENNVTQGQFQKGNKLEGEFDAVMQNSGARNKNAAISWEHAAMLPHKEMLRLNYVYNVKDTVRYNRKIEQDVSIKQADLLSMRGDFKIGDGLLPAQRQMSMEVFRGGLDFISRTPSLTQKVEVDEAFFYLMEMQGASQIADFVKTPQKQAYEQALGAWQQMAQLAIEKGAQFDVPQPIPQQYGYDPQAEATAEQQAQSPQQAIMPDQSMIGK